MCDSDNNKLIMPGKWYADFDDMGNATETFYDDTFRQLLGFTAEEFANDQESWSSHLHPDDRERVDAYFADIMDTHPEGKDYDIEYRLLTRWGYHWFHDYAHISRRADGSVLHFEGVSFDIQHIKDFELQQTHDSLKREILDYIITHDDDDPVELLSHFAERIRVLMGCDQVIYRDLEKTRFMVNSPAIEQTWAVPESYCRQCQHFDAHHAMYAGGYTEMDNCQEGWQGIPVFCKCPIKSSLTRIVYSGSEVAGYLAIHYVQQYHHFTDIERNTCEEFARTLSLLVSRYEARQQRFSFIAALTENNQRVMALEDNFESLYDVELESGHYTGYVKGDFYQSNIADKLLEPGDYFEDLRGNIDAVIYPADRDALFEVLNRDAIRRQLADKERFEHFYRLTFEGEPVWFKIRVVYKDKEKKNVIIGVFNAQEEVAEREKAERDRKQLIDQMAGEDGVFLIDCEHDTMKILHNRINSASDFRDGDSYSANVNRYIDIYTVPADRDTVREAMAIPTMLGRLRTESEYHIRFRDTSSGSPRFLEMKFVKLSDNEVLQSVRDCNDKVQSELLSDRLLSEYISIYVVDTQNLTWKFYKRAAELGNHYPTNEDYVTSLGRYIRTEVHPDDRELVSVLIQPDKLLERLREHRTFNLSYRHKNDFDTRHIRCEVIGSTDEVHVAFAFMDISAEYEEMSRQQLEAEKTRKLVASIAAAYNTAFVVNMRDDSCRLLRMDRDVVGYGRTYKNFTEARDFFLREVCHPSDRELMARELDYSTIRRRLTGTESYDTEYRAVTNDHTLWHLMNITRIDDDEIAIGFVQKDLQLTQKHLEQQRYTEYFALFIADIDRRKLKVVKNTEWFREAREDVSYPYSDTLRRLAMSITGEQQAFFLQLSDLDYVREAFRQEHKRTFAYQSSKMDGRWVDVTCYVTHRHADGTPAEFTIGFSFADQLSADRQELSRQIAEQRLQLQDALSAAKTASEAKTSFLFNMSHDIRTPMNAITGFTTMAKKYVDNRDQVLDYLNKIDVSGQQLLMLINQVLEMARIESGKVEFNEQPVNVKERYDVMTTVLAEQAATRGLTFTCALQDISHYNLLADDTRLSQITLNIVGNAIKYTPEGGHIDFTVREIAPRREGRATLVFTVADTGIGMSEDYLKTIYEPFTRENTSTVSKIQGTGLGMSIVKSLVDLAGGVINVQSTLGEGTRFDITLDFRINDAVSEEQKTVVDLSAFTLEGRRALLVEDNEMNREIARFILEDKGLTIDEADDGDTAVAMMQAVADRGDYHYYDFILMDVQMPRMNGYEATARIRSIAAPADVHIPIVALSANAFEEDRQKSRAAGMDDHIAKPIDITILWETLAKYL